VTIMLRVIMLNVIMLSVVARMKDPHSMPILHENDMLDSSNFLAVMNLLL
jgi:hypothetical protein